MAREIDKNCVEGDCFAINDKSHGVGDNKLNIVYKANYTGQICTAKFRITSKDGSIVKEYMIAQDAKPVYYNIKMVQPFTKDDCLANQHGSVVLYTVEERTYKSFISQEDADAKAMEDIALNGQKYANEHGECITDVWYNEEQRKTFIRNNCDKFSDGQEYVYIIPEGKYVSSISQEDADRILRRMVNNKPIWRVSVSLRRISIMVSLARPLPVTIVIPPNTVRMWLLTRRWLRETSDPSCLRKTLIA